MTTEIRRPGDKEMGTVRALWELCFPEGGPEYTDWYFGSVYRPENTLCLFAGGALASALQMIPYALSIRGRPVAFNTLTGVSTDPDRRNRGHAKALMAAALGDMAARGLGFTFLYPFDHGFYERLGWATCSEALEYRLPAADLPDAPPAGYTARIVTNRVASPALPEIYGRWSAGRNCFSLREEADWLKRFGELEACGGFTVLAERPGGPCAYALCEIERGEINAYELVSLSSGGTLAILSALKSKDLPARWIAPEDDRARLLPGRWLNAARLQPHVMFRATDVSLAFRQARPAAFGRFILEVTDDGMRPENDGVYLVQTENGEAKAVKTDTKPQARCDIGTLARMLAGFMDAEEAAEAGLLDGEKQAVEMLARMYPRMKNFLFELY
jgi:predicted acetyltransferase